MQSSSHLFQEMSDFVAVDVKRTFGTAPMAVPGPPLDIAIACGAGRRNRMDHALVRDPRVNPGSQRTSSTQAAPGKPGIALARQDFVRLARGVVQASACQAPGADAGAEQLPERFLGTVVLIEQHDRLPARQMRLTLRPATPSPTGSRQSRPAIARTISTGQGAWRNTASAVLPISSRPIALRPCVPSTIRSARHSSAALTISRAGSPTRTVSSTFP